MQEIKEFKPSKFPIGQFVAIWTFNNKIWSDTFNYDGKILLISNRHGHFREKISCPDHLKEAKFYYLPKD